MHNLNNTIKQWNDYLTTNINFKHFQVLNKKIVTNDQKTIYDFQSIKYHTTKT
jgi:hypothetical protein